MLVGAQRVSHAAIASAAPTLPRRGSAVGEVSCPCAPTDTAFFSFGISLQVGCLAFGGVAGGISLPPPHPFSLCGLAAHRLTDFILPPPATYIVFTQNWATLPTLTPELLSCKRQSAHPARAMRRRSTYDPRRDETFCNHPELNLCTA